jgi:hypothetical protein
MCIPCSSNAQCSLISLETPFCVTAANIFQGSCSSKCSSNVDCIGSINGTKVIIIHSHYQAYRLRVYSSKKFVFFISIFSFFLKFRLSILKYEKFINVHMNVHQKSFIINENKKKRI